MKTLATVTLDVPQCSQGLHLRWYATGWHYLTLKVGDESYLTAGLNSNTEANAKQRIAVEDVTATNMDALITLARVGSFDVLTPRGWRNGTFDGGDLTSFETDASHYRAEFVLNVYGKTYPYSPVTLAPPVLSDLDILRQMRDTNPTSQLPTLWGDDEDPYTEWEGVTWIGARVSMLNIKGKGIASLSVAGLTALQGLNCGGNQLTSLNVEGLTLLQDLSCYDNQITSLDVAGLSYLQTLYCNYNQLTFLNIGALTSLREMYCNNNLLTGIPSLISKGDIVDCDFTYNLMPPAETDRLINIVGFTAAQVLPQNI